MQSALLLAVPAAEAAVGAHRARLDPSARDGVPAHVTVLYPFLPPAEIGPDVLAELSRLFAGAPRFSFTLDRVRWFNESVVWLGPVGRVAVPGADRARGRGVSLVLALRGHATRTSVPHLTIGQGDGLAELRAAAEAVRPLLPIAAEATG